MPSSRPSSRTLLSRSRVVALLRPFEEICMWLHPRSALVALTSGVFDIAHSGHRRFLARCKSLCDTLVVGVDSDDLVRARKGVNRPFQRELERALNVASLEWPDFVFIKSSSMDNLLPLLRPNVYAISQQHRITVRRSDTLCRLKIRLVKLPYDYSVSTTILLAERERNEFLL
jgi:cytidyltransferase-like protein